MPTAGMTILALLMRLSVEFFLLRVNTEAQVAKYAMAKKNTETEIRRLNPPTKGAAMAAIKAVTLWIMIEK